MSVYEYNEEYARKAFYEEGVAVTCEIVDVSGEKYKKECGILESAKN